MLSHVPAKADALADTGRAARDRVLPVPMAPVRLRYDGVVSGVELNWPWRRALPLAFVFALALPAAADVGETLERIYQDGGLQRELPADDDPHPLILSLPWFAGAPYLLLVAVVAVLAVMLVVWLAGADRERWQERLRSLRRPQRSAAEPSPSANPQLAAADELALQGRYSEAVHALLLAVLAGLSGRDRRWPSAATGREIAARHVRNEDLRSLVAAAELAHFGGRQATREEYGSCRARALRLSFEAGPTVATASMATGSAARARSRVRRGR